MKKSNLQIIIKKIARHRGQMKNKHIIAYVLMLLIFGTFQFQREASHTAEIEHILSQEMQVKDSISLLLAHTIH